MKTIELIKEDGTDGVWFCIEVNGKYLSGSYSRNEDEIRKIFKKVIENEGRLTTKTILESTIIES